jgi:CubicO group peptidase (beta-lactamase class C family)
LRVAQPTTVLVVMCALTFPAVRKASLAEERRMTKLEAIFAPFNDAKSPGVAVLVRKAGRTVFERGYGARDLRSFAAIDPQTNFRLASCTKQFTAMAIMLLVHDGELRYDESLSEVFPEFPAYGKTITIRNLLNHTSGLQDYEALMEQEERSGGHRWTEENQIRTPRFLRCSKSKTPRCFRPERSGRTAIPAM